MFFMGFCFYVNVKKGEQIFFTCSAQRLPVKHRLFRAQRRRRLSVTVIPGQGVHADCVLVYVRYYGALGKTYARKYHRPCFGGMRGKKGHLE